jgi:hypothetical protein
VPLPRPCSRDEHLVPPPWAAPSTTRAALLGASSPASVPQMPCASTSSPDRKLGIGLPPRSIARRRSAQAATHHRSPRPVVPPPRKPERQRLMPKSRECALAASQLVGTLDSQEDHHHPWPWFLASLRDRASRQPIWLLLSRVREATAAVAAMRFAVALSPTPNTTAPRALPMHFFRPFTRLAP